MFVYLMNFFLYFGLFGILEVGVIVLLVGLFVYFLWLQLCCLLWWLMGYVIGWFCVIVVIIVVGIDVWKLFYMGIVWLELLLYVCIFLVIIYDLNEFGSCVVLEIVGVFVGVVFVWVLFSLWLLERIVE